MKKFVSYINTQATPQSPITRSPITILAASKEEFVKIVLDSTEIHNNVLEGGRVEEIGKVLKIHKDQDAANPFTEWDGNWDMWTHTSDHTIEYATSSFREIIEETLKEKSEIHNTWYEAHLDTIRNYCLDFDDGRFLDALADSLECAFDDAIEQLEEYIDGGLPEMSDFCDEFDVPHYYNTSGRYSEVLIIPTKDKVKEFGRDVTDDFSSELLNQFELYENWAWGNVYYFSIEWEDDDDYLDSCGGFYGQDVDGILEHVKAHGFTKEDVEQAFEDIVY